MEKEIQEFLGLRDKRTFENWKQTHSILIEFLNIIFEKEENIKSFVKFYIDLDLGKISYKKRYLELVASFLEVDEQTVYRWRKKEDKKMLFFLIEESFKNEEMLEDFLENKKLNSPSDFIIKFFSETSTFFQKINIYDIKLFSDTKILNYYFSIFNSVKVLTEKKDIAYSLMYEEKRLTIAKDDFYDYDTITNLTEFLYAKNEDFKRIDNIPLSEITPIILKNSQFFDKHALTYVIIYYLFREYYQYLKEFKFKDIKIASFSSYCNSLIRDFANSKQFSFTKLSIDLLHKFEQSTVYFIANYDERAFKIV